MGDDDLIRRGDAARAVALCSAESDSPNAHFVCRQAVNAIRAIPAADAQAEALKEAADAWAAYKAANTTVAHWEAVARLDAALIPEKQP